MKTGDILLETKQKVVEISLDFNDLSSIQIGALRAIHDGRLDFDNASDRMQNVLYDLQDFNLIDDFYELTPTGQKAVKLAMEIGGSERRQAAQRAAKANMLDQDEDVYDTAYPVDNDDFGADDDEDLSIYQPNRYGTANDTLG